MAEVSPPLLAVRDLGVRFPGADVRAVDGIDVEVRAGEVVALVGESGSGKSVSALAVLGLLPRDAEVTGSITYRGEEVLDAELARVRELRGGEVALIFQDPGLALDPVFTVGSQVAEVVRLHQPGLSRADVRRRVVELLRTVGVPEPETRVDVHPHQLSGGLRQRVMIATALAGGPRVLIADEPTTALDVTVQLGILDLLDELRRTQDLGILLITHDMGVVADLADRVVVLKDGRVVERAPTVQLFEAPQHAYSRALLAAVPRGRDRAAVLGPVTVSDGVGPAPAPVLQVRDLSVNYRTRFSRTPDVVRGVSFAIGAGEMLGLVGESGSGKSSIGRSILGLAPVTGGTITLDGVHLESGRVAARRQAAARVGMVFQDPAGSLNPRLSVLESVAEPIVTQQRQPRRAVTERAAELLEQVNLPADLLRRYPHELSGGQKQRVAIARALALDPAVLVADEPTSALDVSIQAQVIELLARLQAERGFACLFISHDLVVVEGLCTRVLVLKDGQVVEEGDVADVLRQPRRDYTRELVLAAPVPDPVEQRRRRAARSAA
ncbi:glutathione ABC transporter ATP-binding protein [Serinibacter arcticus]|uniref:Glutathione ABC transporter ATP-binding protein n=1 Tax=Serinibacter arcticus TaxID=1655435 RepID=A0A2U1ZVD8_9MICO|nr:ABC transporter ATP-binding protein [Serinibacter arcticus]PWD50957.1 glutathione ABC transporter ATP-binding protein [Serinibacter arcticus]